jgi:hypothetical protein
MAKLLAWWSWRGRRVQPGEELVESLSMASPRSILSWRGTTEGAAAARWGEGVGFAMGYRWLQEGKVCTASGQSRSTPPA